MSTKKNGNKVEVAAIEAPVKTFITHEENAPRNAKGILINLKRSDFEKGKDGSHLFVNWMQLRAEETYRRQCEMFAKMHSRIDLRTDPKAKLAAQIAALQAKLAQL